MKKRSTIEFKFEGQENGQAITPDTLDISDLQEYLKDISDFLLARNNRKERKKDKRPRITVAYEEGSVKLLLTISSMLLASVSDDIKDIAKKDFNNIPEKRIDIVQKWQKWCKSNETLSINLSIENQSLLKIDAETDFLQDNAAEFQEEEIYLYGEITSVGGDSKPNIHLKTSEYGAIIIETDRRVIATDDTNRVYKSACIHAKVFRSIYTGELREKRGKFIDLIEHQPRFDQEKLDALIEQATPDFKELPDNWVRQIRGEL